MDDTTEPFNPIMPKPTAARPMLGLTVLVIEDSRFACEAMRLLCLRSGARIRRADSLRSARRHLQTYQPSVAVVDLGLPDGSGIELIAELAQKTPRPYVLLGMSGDPNGEGEVMQAGADGFMEKPVKSLSVFQEMVLQHLPADRRPNGPREISSDEVVPDPIAFRDDMAHAADVISTREDDRALGYVTQFLSGVARSANDTTLESAVKALQSKLSEGGPTVDALAQLDTVMQERLSQRASI